MPHIRPRRLMGRSLEHEREKLPDNPLDLHIAALGLSSLDEYQAWCRANGFAVDGDKNWRDERAEVERSRQLQAEAKVLGHLRALDLDTVQDYLVWCQVHSLEATTEKSYKQRQRELALVRQLRPQPVARVECSIDAEHLEALGLETLDDYRLWCRQNRLSEALNKTAPALRRERELAALAAAKRQRRRLGDLLRRIHAGQVPRDEIRLEALAKVHDAFAAWTDGADRDALLRLLLHVEGRSELVAVTPGVFRWREQEGNTFIEGLIALARNHRSWLRPVEEWKPRSRNAQRQFSSLARHLLASYAVPDFMDSVFFKGGGEEARRQQRWFEHMGGGGNIRSADVPVRLSKRMAHLFLQAPSSSTVEEAMRWGQVMGQGGSPYLAEAINATALGRSFADEDFWGTVVHFFTLHPMLDPSYVTIIVDFIRAQRFVAQEIRHPDGRVEMIPPPQPNFSMKSRSVLKLLRQVDQWRARLATDAAYVPADQWQSSGNGGLTLTEEDPRSGQPLTWTISEIISHRQLLAEGESMRHCIVSYAKSCERGETSIWSLKANIGGTARHVMTVAINILGRTVTQARGKFNADPEHEIKASALLRQDTSPKGDSRLNATDRFYITRAYRILRFWLEREGVTYAQTEG
jgi:hypothetical protein